MLHYSVELGTWYYNDIMSNGVLYLLVEPREMTKNRSNFQGEALEHLKGLALGLAISPKGQTLGIKKGLTFISLSFYVFIFAFSFCGFRRCDKKTAE